MTDDRAALPQRALGKETSWPLPASGASGRAWLAAPGTWIPGSVFTWLASPCVCLCPKLLLLEGHPLDRTGTHPGHYEVILT